MKQLNILFLLFLCIVFILGFFVNLYGLPIATKENMASDSGAGPSDSGIEISDCPDLLVKRGDVLLLYNTSKPLVDNKNPIPFFNLDEYINYLEVQRNKGIRCPVLYLQQENNTQGEDVYRIRPSPFDLQGGTPSVAPTALREDVVTVVDSSRENKPYNAGNYPGFDPTSQYVGVYTNIDKVHDSTEMNKISDNPMDSNWAGVTYTQQMVDSGKYIDNQITRPIYTQPKTSFYPGLPAPTEGPRDVL